MPEPKKDFRSSNALSWKAVADGQELLVNGFLWPSASTPPTLHVQVGVDLMVPTSKKTSSNNSLTCFEWARYMFQVFGMCGFPSAWDSGAHHTSRSCRQSRCRQRRIGHCRRIGQMGAREWLCWDPWHLPSRVMVLCWYHLVSSGIIWYQRLGLIMTIQGERVLYL